MGSVMASSLLVLPILPLILLHSVQTLSDSTEHFTSSCNAGPNPCSRRIPGFYMSLWNSCLTWLRNCQQRLIGLKRQDSNKLTPPKVQMLRPNNHSKKRQDQEAGFFRLQKNEKEKDHLSPMFYRLL